MSSTAEHAPRPHRWTVDEYMRLGETGMLHEDDRVELIDGELIDMSPIGSPHAAIVNRLNRLLVQAAGDAAVVAVQNPIVLGQHSAPQPDLALLYPRQDDYAARHPQASDIVLLIEVAISSATFDRNIKLPLYARQGVPEVWLIDLQQQTITRYSTPTSDGYRDVTSLTSLTTVAPINLPSCTVSLERLLHT